MFVDGRSADSTESRTRPCVKTTCAHDRDNVMQPTGKHHPSSKSAHET